MTRHALSCANVVQSNAQGVFGTRQHSLMLDPSITQCGLVRSSSASAAVAAYLQNRTIDFVLSSSLTRAMETAMHQYPGHTVIPVPYISEHSPGYDNRPADVGSQISKISARYPDMQGRINFEWMRHRVWGEAANRYNKPSFTSFLEFLIQDFLPRGAFAKKELTIAVVTHSHFMKAEEPIASQCGHFFDVENGKPFNNQIVEISYDVAMGTIEAGVALFPEWNATLAEVGGAYCRSAFASLPAVRPNMVCEADVGDVCMAEMELLTWTPNIMTKEQEIVRLTARRDAALTVGATDEQANRTAQEERKAALVARTQEEIEQLRASACCVT